MTAERFAARRRALVAQLEVEGLDGLIVTALPNVRYLTGFTGSAAIGVVRRAETVLLTDSRYRTQAADEIGDGVRLEIADQQQWRRLWDVVGTWSDGATLGCESHVLTVQQAGRLAESAGAVVLQPVADCVERLRAIKSPEEIASIREAARLAGEALDAVLGTIRVGDRERDIAARLEHELRVRGSEWHPFPTIVASGPNTALPHARSGTRSVGAGEWLLLDFGARVDGYCADITRTVVVGRPADERQRAVYEVVECAQRQARAGLRAGMVGRDGDALARSVITERGFGEAFGHSLGHGLGLEVHEAPRLSKTNEEPLPEGAVVTVEPGIYIAGWGGVRIEDDVVVRSDGTELLSDGRTALVELT